MRGDSLLSTALSIATMRWKTVIFSEILNIFKSRISNILKLIKINHLPTASNLQLEETMGFHRTWISYVNSVPGSWKYRIRSASRSSCKIPVTMGVVRSNNSRSTDAEIVGKIGSNHRLPSRRSLLQEVQKVPEISSVADDRNRHHRL